MVDNGVTASGNIAHNSRTTNTGGFQDHTRNPLTAMRGKDKGMGPPQPRPYIVLLADNLNNPFAPPSIEIDRRDRGSICIFRSTDNGELCRNTIRMQPTSSLDKVAHTLVVLQTPNEYEVIGRR